MTNLQIARVGFGAWALDGGGWSFGWGREDDDDSIEAVRNALELGIDWFDTTALYDLEDSEDVGGEPGDLLPADHPYVFTKCGLIWDIGTRTGEARRARWPATIREKCEASLRGLGVERVDLYRLLPDETGTLVDRSARATTPAFGAHRTGMIWYSTSQVDLLGEAMSRSPIPASAVAVAWTLASRGVAGAIVGASPAERIDCWVDAVTLVLTRANLGEIVSAIGRTGASNGAQLPAALAA